MLQAIKELGEISLKEKGITDFSEPCKILVENPKADKVIEIIFKIDADKKNIKFKEVRLSDFDKNNFFKYLYKKGSPNGINYTPAALLTEKDTFGIKILKWFEKFCKENLFIDKIYQEMKSNEKTIRGKIYLYVGSKQDKNSKYFLTISFEETNIYRYLEYHKEFREYFEKLAVERFNTKTEKEKVCAICNELKTVSISGMPSRMTFYNTDKAGYISSGFDEIKSWKNMPLCLECGLLMDEGWQYLGNNLLFRFAGLQYFLIPKDTIKNNDLLHEFLISVNDARDELKEGKVRSFDNIKTLIDEEDYVSKIIKDKSDFLTINLMFYEKSSSALYINKLIQNVIPSRYSELFAVKQTVDKLGIFKNAKKSKGETRDIKFEFRILRSFSIDNDQFLDVTDKIFKNIQIDYGSVISGIIRKLRQDFIEQKGWLNNNILESFSLLLFLTELNLLNNLTINSKNIMNDKKISNEIDQFFIDHKIFNSEAKKGVFLLGILVQKLLSIQWRERNADPFRAQLKNLKLTQNDIQNLLPKAVNKLEEYNKNYYRELESTISYYFLKAGGKWDESSDELNYFLVLGMSLSSYVSDNVLGLEEINPKPTNQ